MTGLALNELDGKLLVKNINLSKADKEWNTDLITLESKNQGGLNGLFLEADFVDLALEGNTI